MDQKSAIACLLVATVTVCVFFSFTTDTYYYKHIQKAFAQLSPKKNLVSHALEESHGPRKPSDISTSIQTRDPPVMSTISHTTIPTSATTRSRSGLRIENLKELRQVGLESRRLHAFQSPYIIDPIIYDKDNIYRAPGKRNVKIISCFNCPFWFGGPNQVNSRNRDFRVCPYSECYFDPAGDNHTAADVVLFFPVSLPSELPDRTPGQIWAHCVWESPNHWRYPPFYSVWKDAFNWTITYREDADVFAPYFKFAWRAKETLMSDTQYFKIAMSKTRTAAWFVSHCTTKNKREEYVKRMQKIIDIDVFGLCSGIQCDMQECLKKLNTTYKFYIAFENSFCKDYVTEKLFRNFDRRLQIVPVARGGFDYQKHVPPNTIVDASQFDSPEALAEYLRELADDLPRYTAMLKEKDKLTVLNYKFDWCELCERLHKGVKPKMIKDIKNLTHYPGVCWPPNL